MEGRASRRWASVGQQSVLCGGSKGSPQLRSNDRQGRGPGFMTIHHFKALDSAVVSLASNPRDKGFCARAKKGSWQSTS